MTWQILWTDEAVRDLSRLDRQVALRIVKKVEGLATDPHRFFRRLKGSDDYRLRIGDYRVLALLDAQGGRLIVETVKHRSVVYRDR
jgi:mRNA interferase RelE/StbE